VNYLIYLINGI